MGAKRLEDRVASILQRVERELDDAGGWGGRAGRWVGGWVGAGTSGWVGGRRSERGPPEGLCPPYRSCVFYECAVCLRVAGCRLTPCFAAYCLAD